MKKLIATSFLVFVIVVMVYCQDTRSVLIFRSDTIIRASILNNDPEIKPEAQKLYYWFSSETIHKNMGGYAGNLLDGKYLAFNKQNNLIVAGNFKTGVKNGEWKYWDYQGELLKLLEYKSGQLHGKAYFFDPQEQVYNVKKYKNGRLLAEWIEENGKKVPENILNESEQKTSESEETNNRKRLWKKKIFDQDQDK